MNFVKIPSGWWFGCHQFSFPINIGNNSSSQLTIRHIFLRGVAKNHQPAISLSQLSIPSLSHLVGGLEHQFYFPIYWEFHHPNWRFVIFFRGVAKNHQPVISLSQLSIPSLSHLVGGLEHEFYFPIYWEFHHPNWRFVIFFRTGWRKTTNQSSHYPN